jgi:hypothetical protein
VLTRVCLRNSGFKDWVLRFEGSRVENSEEGDEEKEEKGGIEDLTPEPIEGEC